MKYFIKTFGCQMNYSDSERIAGFLEAKKMKPAENTESANLVIFNTCGIRQAAEDRALSIIHALKKSASSADNQRLKKKKIIILTGCLANRKDVQKKLKNKVDLFCEIKDLSEKVLSMLYKVSNIKKDKKIHNTSYKIHSTKNLSNKENLNYLTLSPKHNNNFQALVPIMTGCNNFCSYCVVPYARGREVSRPTEEIICEIKNLVKNGYKEITLLGQNVNSYRHESGSSTSIMEVELPRVINFSQLLKKINAIPGHFWIRFVSSHPKDFSDELIETVAKSKKVCEHIHLPVQAGSDEILQKMNRKYTAKHYLKLIRKIRSAFKKYKPGILYSITSDIIVGFPGETKKQFLESAKIMEKAKFDLVYFGRFSPRPETAAWKMKDNVSKKEKARREKFLNEILKKTAPTNNKKYKNTTQEVLFEEPSEAKLRDVSRSLASDSASFVYFGKTRSGKNVKIHLTPCLAGRQTSLSLARRWGDNLIGKFVKVKIIKANIWNLEGELRK